jgi:hypothetical protein
MLVFLDLNNTQKKIYKFEPLVLLLHPGQAPEVRATAEFEDVAGQSLAGHFRFSREDWQILLLN